MRLIAVFFAIVLMSAAPVHAGCKIVKTGVAGSDSVLTGVIRGFEAGPPPKEGDDTGIYLEEPCEFVITWKAPYPKACKVGRKITAKGFYDPDIGIMFLAESISCK
jgi:hypothetical protein